MYKQKSLDNETEVFLDPNTFSTDGTIALQGTSFSKDGSKLAYGLSESGSDWIKIRIRDVKTGEDFPDVLNKVKFSSMSWTHDNKGLFYNVCLKFSVNIILMILKIIYRYFQFLYFQRYPDQDGKTDGSETVKNENQKLYYHRIGDPQEKDVLVVEFPENPSWRM